MNLPLFPRTTDLYENCKVLSPEGKFMFFCKLKKGNWYLNHNLANVITEVPLVIQLIFQPKGIGWGNDKFAATLKENKCVVCGKQENLSRHHIIPSCYRKYFPVNFKRDCHDIVLMCVNCHNNYESKAYDLKLQLSQKYKAPLNLSEQSHFKSFNSALSAARALYFHYNEIPYEGVIKLLKPVEKYLNKTNITEKDLEILAKQSKQYSKVATQELHGYIIVSQLTNLQKFSELWRQHFIDNANPKFMPKFWDVKRIIDVHKIGI